MPETIIDVFPTQQCVPPSVGHIICHVQGAPFPRDEVTEACSSLQTHQFRLEQRATIKTPKGSVIDGGLITQKSFTLTGRFDTG